MALETTISFPVFNILKYIIVFFFIDVIVRTSLNRLTDLYRSYSVYKGYSVSLARPFGDRFNTSSLLFSKLNVFSFSLVLLSISTYAVELFLEFSTDSIVKHVGAPERLLAVSTIQTACNLDQIAYGDNWLHLSHVADECVKVDVVDDTDNAASTTSRPAYRYTIYAPSWIREGGANFLSCIDTDDNILAQGDAVYSGNNLDTIGSEFTKSLKRNSYGARDEEQSVITLEVDSSNLLTVAATTEGHETGRFFNSGVLRKVVPNTSISCFGNVFGRLGEGQMKVELWFCLNGTINSAQERAFMYASGTAWLGQDARKIREPWSVKVATTNFREIINFGRGVLNSTGLFHVLPYAIFLGRTSNRDFVSIQRYAAVFKHCASIKLPDRNSTWESAVVPRAKKVAQVRISVQIWAVILILSWPLLLLLLVQLIQYLTRSLKMPRNMHGEEDIGRRWYHELRKKTTNENMDGGDMARAALPNSRFKALWLDHLYLSVCPGEHEDDVTVTKHPVFQERVGGKPFAEI